MKKNIIYIFAILSLISCSDILEEELTGDLTGDGVFIDEEGIDFALNGAYASLGLFIGNSPDGRDDTNRETGWTLIAYGTDTYTNGSDGGFKYFNTYDSDLNASSRVVRESWDEFYKGINAANTVIGRSPDAIVNNPEKLTRVTAEARFLRAYFYYWLVRIWGPVHYTDEETKTAETEAHRMALDELYPKIIEDLKFAEENLPGVQNDFGRATSWAAKSTLADLYLTRKNYDQAATYAEDIINNGPFSLVNSFSELWELDNEESSEVIWSTQFADELEYDNGGNPAHLFFLMEYDKLPGMKRDVVNGRPWKRFRPTNYLLDLYDMEDQRYDATFVTVYYANNPDSAPSGVAVGDTAVYLPRVPLSQAEKDTKPYGESIYNQDEYTEKTYPSSKKWIQPNRASANEVSGGRDFIAYRLAEIYLIAAEAHALKSSPDQTKALFYLNEVRKRAYGVDDDSALPPITAVDIDIILEERAKELAQEGKRWFDLVRTGKLVERVKMHNPQAASFIQDYHSLRPIPLTQIDRTSNDFPQNPGY
ncbi:RagB/SusD family nutrient uptake outer membrane protein [Galbibacter sp. EGI 63066]|uniref:RagB/SusD family nutrient uptake outer membrane protein n=1 Tax=Galbibacter sp. EGI 63066 TaxID=2993559 RepID=UPI002248B1F6|nr:RagB/SusD family nutrient uptake outer membrane protein [Galbibacter sp. EGI 63066]MCX2680864.1 RagB/SusD family nutrient uptake outer membrane protein [Galbibacter sp. EGI 63066]